MRRSQPVGDAGARCCTIGYEAGTQPGLIAALQAAGATVLADVRALANSRKPGFAKRTWRRRWRQAGIALSGTCPRSARRRRGGRRRGPAAGGDAPHLPAHLAGDRGAGGAGRADRPARAEPVCLLCLEDDPARCHRTLVAEAVTAATGAPVRHLHPAAA